MTRQKIIFVRTRSDADVYAQEGSVLSGRMTACERDELLCRFESGAIRTLVVVGSGLCTGWRVNVPDVDVDVVFIGAGWAESDMAQGRVRVRPTFLC